MTRFVLALRFDEKMDRAIRGMWDAIADQGIAVAGRTGHRPHISIAAYEVEDIQRARDTLDHIAHGVERFPIRLHSLGIFPERKVVFLAPHITEKLFSLHRTILS